MSRQAMDGEAGFATFTLSPLSTPPLPPHPSRQVMDGEAGFATFTRLSVEVRYGLGFRV